MFLCGLDVPERRILRLARLVEDEKLEMKLRSALAQDVRVLALNRDERETILLSLDDPPAGLEDLHGVLLRAARQAPRRRTLEAIASLRPPIESGTPQKRGPYAGL